MTAVQKLVDAARRTLRVVGWTPSRFAKWKECPAKVLYEDLMHMCPICFLGKVSGGFDGEPVVCDTCSDPQPEREALDRGNRLDAALTNDLARTPLVEMGKKALAAQGVKELKLEDVRDQHEVSLAEAARHPVVRAMVQKLKKTKSVFTQESIVLARGWKRVGQFTKGAWGRLKLDVLRLTPKQAIVIDWKSGNIDKKTNQIRPRDEYNDSMRVYQIAVLSVFPQPEASATMVFLDAPPKLADPTKSLPVLKRIELASAQKDWERKIEPMMGDTVFAPRPGVYCGWCGFSKRRGGPCQF